MAVGLAAVAAAALALTAPAGFSRSERLAPRASSVAGHAMGA